MATLWDYLVKNDSLWVADFDDQKYDELGFYGNGLTLLMNELPDLSKDSGPIFTVLENEIERDNKIVIQHMIIHEEGKETIRVERVINEELNDEFLEDFPFKKTFSVVRKKDQPWRYGPPDLLHETCSCVRWFCL